MIPKILTMLLGLTLILAVACGSAAEPTAAPEPTATQAAETAPAAEHTTAPAESETSQPTAVPQMAAPPAEVEVNPGKLTIMVGDLGTEGFNYSFAPPGGGNVTYGRIMGGYLISDNEKREMVPGIAEDWSFSDDGLTWTFTIREGVKFHDGSDVTPEDVLWTLQHYVGPQAQEYTLSSTAGVISRVMDRIELSGPAEVSATAKEPVTELAVRISEAGTAWMHIMPQRAELHDKEVELAYDNNPIGAGSMKLIGHTRAQVMEFERFEDFYYQPENGFDVDKRMKFRLLDVFVVPEEATRVAALRAGDADIVPTSLTTKEQVEAGGGRLVFGQEGALFEIRLLGCWEEQYPCHDKRVRQALDYTIDKELMQTQLYGGPDVFQVKGWAQLSPTTIGYTPELDPWPFDPDKARQLLAEAGYPNGEGFGKLIVNTYPSTVMPFIVESAQIAADLWRRELGLDVEVRVRDTTGTKKLERAGDLNGQVLWRDNETRRDPRSTIDAAYGDFESGRRLHENPELLQVVQETLQILDEEESTRALEKTILRLRDESYMLGVGYVNIPWGVGPRVETWEPYPLASYPSALHTITLK